MLKKETLDLLNSERKDFKNIFSICIGKTYLFQNRLKEYFGDYKQWNTDIKEGILKLDEKSFNVEYIGTTSIGDNYWYSSEVESVIPDQFVNLMINTRKTLESLGLKELAEVKIPLTEEINGYNLAMIYVAFAKENVACFCGSGDTTIYMFLKQLPESIFKKINSTEFSSKVAEIISTFSVNHKLMVKALLCENDIEFSEDNNNIVAKFNEKSILTIEFNNDGLLTTISGDLSL